MNTARSVAYGWAAFTVAGVAGAYIGYKQWEVGKEKRRLEQEEVKARQAEVLEKINRRRTQEQKNNETAIKENLPTNSSSSAVPSSSS